jgi:hypothetical protein
MNIIKVSTSNPELTNGFIRQSPNGAMTWGGCRFFVNQFVPKCDWWIICHNSALVEPESTLCDPNHIIFISMEPTDSWIPSAFFYQFNQLVLCDRNINHPKIKYANGTTWWVGINVHHENGHHFLPDINFTYDTLSALTLPKKQNRISVICSRNQSLPGHTKRLAFIDKLMNHPINKLIDFYGGGIRPIPDKWDSIAPYKYHLVLENSTIPDYWSEKLGDAYLGYAFPIYYGCPNIADYFKIESLKIVDIENFEQTVSILENLLSMDKYEEFLPAIIEARNKVLNDYNIFNLMADICDEPAAKFQKCKIKPVSYFERSWPRRTARKFIYSFRGIKF